MDDDFVEVEPIDDSWDRSYQDKPRIQSTYVQTHPQTIYKPTSTVSPWSSTPPKTSINMASSQGFSEVGDAPPEFSISVVLNSIRERGFTNTFNDESLGPHVHLLLLISIVIIISLAIGAIQFAFGG